MCGLPDLIISIFYHMENVFAIKNHKIYLFILTVKVILWYNKYIKIIYTWKKMLKMYKNIDKKTKLELKDLVEYQSGQVLSKTLVQN